MTRIFVFRYSNGDWKFGRLEDGRMEGWNGLHHLDQCISGSIAGSFVLEQFGANLIQFDRFPALGLPFAAEKRRKMGGLAFVPDCFLNFIFRGSIRGYLIWVCFLNFAFFEEQFGGGRMERFDGAQGKEWKMED